MKLILRFFRIVNKFNNQTVLYGAVFLYPKTGRNERIWHLPDNKKQSPNKGTVKAVKSVQNFSKANAQSIL